jgi:CMP-N-acetylneuraminic acid synthetase
MPEVLAIIPARGGSKGLPGKNLRSIGGRTLVGWAVSAARDASLVNRVVGSTDDEAIADELRRCGAEVPLLRPAELAGDDVPDPPVFLHVLDVLGATERYVPDIVVNVRPTAPSRTGDDIDGALRTLIATPAARSVKAVAEAAEHPYKMWTMEDGCILEPLLPTWLDQHGGNPDVPRQKLPTVYRSSGAVDAVWATALRETGMFHPGPVVGYVLEAARDIDIDTIGDLRRAEALLEGRSRD